MAGGEETATSVVVSTYDKRRWDDLSACLRSLETQTRPPLETIVVVDHNPALLERVAARFPAVTAIANERPRGLAGARNQGIARARGGVVAFIDDDARAEPDWLQQLERCFERPDVVGAGGALLPLWEGPERSWIPPEFYWVFGCSYAGLPTEMAPIRNPIGANMAVRASVLEAVGGFREGEEAGAPRELRARGVVRAGGNVPDDTDLAIRVNQQIAGAVWLYQPEARVLHTVTPERASLGYFLRRSFEEGVGKASLTDLVGAESGLSSERRQLASVIPKGMLRELRAFLRLDPAAAARALAMLAGTGAAGLGFLGVALRRAVAPPGRRGGAREESSAPAILPRVRSSEPPSPEFASVRMDDVEIGAPLPRLAPVGPDGGDPFAGSICLVRLHGKPLGTIELELPAEGVAPERLAETIDTELGAQIAKHLRADGIEPRRLDAAGLGSDVTPACEVERLEFLGRAPRASVVICTRDRPDSVRTTLRSILASRYPSERYEVIVVDNAAENDAIVDLVAAEFQGEVEVRAVREPEPGLSHARNRGLAAAGGEFVVFADDDVLVDRDWLATLLACFEDGERVGATSGLTLPDVLETPTQRWVEGFGGRIRGFDRLRFDLDDPPPDRPLFPFTIGEFGAGRNMAFRRDLLQELGGFDPALGPGTLAHDGDDVEALLRVLLSGHRIVHDPAAIVWHAHPREYGELVDRVWGYGIGLTACLTRAMLDHPRLLPELLRKLPRGVAFALSEDSDKNAGRQADYPRRLVRRELGGMAYGPLAYTRSRIQQRGRRRAAAAAPPAGGG